MTQSWGYDDLAQDNLLDGLINGIDQIRLLKLMAGKKKGSPQIKEDELKPGIS